MSHQGINVRTAFEARPGYYFLDCDYSQIEARLSALIAGETSLIKSFDEGKDYYTTLYSLMMAGGDQAAAAKIYPTVTKKQRQLGKVIVLGQNYGQEKWGLAHNLKCPVEQAEDLMTQFWEGQPATKRAKEEALQKALRDGGVWTYFGRWRSLPELYSSDRKIKAKAQRSVWSTKIQGTAADVMKIAMIRAAKAISLYDVYMILTVHDELLFEVSIKENLYEITNVVVDAMEFPIRGLPMGAGEESFIKLPTEPEYGWDWGTLFSKEKFVEKYGEKINTDKPSLGIENTRFIAPNNEADRIPIPEKVNRKVRGKVVMQLKPGQHPVDAVIDAAYEVMGKECPVDTEPSIQPVNKQVVFEEKPPMITPEQLKAQQVTPVVDVTQKPVPVKQDESNLLSTEPPNVIEIKEEVSDKTIFVQNKEQLNVIDETIKDTDRLVGLDMSADPSKSVVSVVDMSGGDPKVTDIFEVEKVNKQLSEVADALTPREPQLVEEISTPSQVSDQSVDGQNENDFVYPCLIIKVEKDLNRKLLQFLKTLFEKFPGDYRIYIDYKDQLITSNISVDPSDIFMSYLRKALGSDVDTQKFNKQGKPQGRIAFV